MRQRASARIRSLAFSAIITVGALVLPEVIVGITLASTTRSPATPRNGHKATLLPDGSVLVTGGTGGSALDERYDPVSGTWSPAGSELFSRTNDHTATLMPDGTVLVAGSTLTSDLYQQLEIYDPATNAWNLLHTSETRSSHTATLLADGSVLLAGGFGPFDLASSGQLIRSATDYLPAWQPQLSSVSFDPAGPLVVLGTGFRHQPEASGGSTHSSGTNYPMVQLRQLDNGKSTFLRPNALTGFNEVVFFSEAVAPYAGHVLVTVFVNGVPSTPVILPGAISDIQDYDGDGFSDLTEYQARFLLGTPFDPFDNEPELTGAFDFIAKNSGYYDQAEYDANRTAGQNDVINDPNVFDLYSLSQIEALFVDAPLLIRDEATGLFTITISVQKSPDLVNFQPFPMDESNTLINTAGQLEFTFSVEEDTAFFTLEVQ